MFPEPTELLLIGYSIESLWTPKSKSNTLTPKTNSGRHWLQEHAHQQWSLKDGARRRWQHVAASKVEYQHREELFAHMGQSHRAQVRFPGRSRRCNGLVCNPNALSHTDPASLVPCCDVETSPTPFASFVAHMPVWPPFQQVLPEHRALEQGCWGEGRFALKSATARVTTNIMVRDLDLGEPRAADGRRLEVVVDALVSGMCQLVVDATVVCTLHCDGSPHRAENMDGVVTQNWPWWGPEEEPVSWFLALRLEAACPWKPLRS